MTRREIVRIGHRNTALSEKGVRQARLLAERLRHDRFTHVYTSDLMRAKQVTNIICQKIYAVLLQVRSTVCSLSLTLLAHTMYCGPG